MEELTQEEQLLHDWLQSVYKQAARLKTAADDCVAVVEKLTARCKHRYGPVEFRSFCGRLDGVKVCVICKHDVRVPCCVSCGSLDVPADSAWGVECKKCYDPDAD